MGQTQITKAYLLLVMKWYSQGLEHPDFTMYRAGRLQTLSVATHFAPKSTTHPYRVASQLTEHSQRKAFVTLLVSIQKKKYTY